MKMLFQEGRFEEAAEVADSINWNKVKNVNALVKAGEVYENVERYDDSREILLNAYDRSPIGRTIIYRLAELAIKMEDFDGAKEYYDEFVDIAPHDNQRYVLQYNIKKAQGAPWKELIPILEEFKDQEYTEEWAYELAYLYHKTGMIEKCIDACDELILWFGDGPYVERSLELKMLYQPLTKVQEEKYRKYRHEREGKTVIGMEEMERAGEYVHDPVVIPQVTLNPSRFNTTNLQEEIAKGMQQIMDATEKETVVGTMDNIKKIVEEIPYLQIPREEVEESSTDVHIETDEEIDGSLKINFQELLEVDSDGQVSLLTEEKAKLDQQITGQMSIAEVLEEWEKTKRAAEAALQEAEQRKLESAKARALQEAEDIMVRLNDVIPRIQAGTTPRELLEEEYLQNELQVEPIIPAFSEVEMPKMEFEMEVPAEETLSEEGDVDKKTKEASLLFESVNSILDQEIARLSTEAEILNTKVQEMIAEQAVEEIPLEQQPTIRFPEISIPEDVLPEIVLDEESVFVEETPVEDNLEEALVEEVPAKEEVFGEEKSLKDFEVTVDIEDLDEPVSKPINALTEEQKAIFSYFVPVKGMEEQLCKVLSGILANLKGSARSSVGNLIVQGCQGCGKTVLATSIIKVLQQECGRPNGRIGKMDAEALNKKDVRQLLKKVAGGCIIIERAGLINRETAVAMSLLLEQETSGTLVILEDTAAGIKKAMMVDDGFAKKFTETITVPIFTNEELVTFARAYANELGYEIDEMAVLALYNSISNIERLNQATTLAEVKEIIDDAIEVEANSGLRKAIGILTANRYTDDEKIVLTEKDFK